MSMYDTIDGEIIKCFPWVSYDPESTSPDTKLNIHNGSCASFQIGKSVPYRQLHYNYTPNFMIIDAIPEAEDLLCILHVIRHGILKTSIHITKTYQPSDYDPNLDKWFDTNQMVIDLYGRMNLKIKTIQDACRYAYAYVNYQTKWQAANKDAVKYWNAYRKTISSINKLDHESEEYLQRMTQAAIQQEQYRNAIEKQKIDRLKIATAFADKWARPSSNKDEQYKKLGQWLFAAKLILQQNKSDSHLFQKFKNDFVSVFPRLSQTDIDGYHEWHNSQTAEKMAINLLLRELQS